MTKLLDAKLNKIETAVTQVKEQYSMAPNASIDELNKGLAEGIKHFMNVFIQEEQPEGFEGIWIQEPKRNWTTLYNDEYIPVKDQFEAIRLNTVAATADETWVSLNGYFYSIVGKVVRQYTKDQPQLLINTTTLPVGNSYAYLYTFVHGDKLYSIGYVDWIEYDPATGTGRVMPALEGHSKNHKYTDGKNHYAYHQGILYCFSPSGSVKFDFSDESVTPIAQYGDTNEGFGPYTMSPVVNNKIYLTGFKRSGGWDGHSVCYHIDTNSYGGDTLLSAIHAANVRDNYLGSAVLVGKYLYTMKVTSKHGYGLTRIDADTGERTSLDILPFSGVGNVWGRATDAHLANLDGRLVLFSGDQGGRQIYRLEDDTLEYEDGSLVISEGKYWNGVMSTVLYQLPKPTRGRITYPFYDVVFVRDGEKSLAPTYYGNGSEWIKFKN
jgi:hypothetical protein